MAMLDEIMSVVLKHYESMYDEGDPSMTALGQDVWNEQCEDAVEVLSDKISQLISENTDALIEGEFHIYFPDIPSTKN